MKANDIEEIINKIGELPYNCIMFDGEWGVGKTYAIDKALENHKNVCKISMFGMKNSKQIYHEILFQLALKDSVKGWLKKITINISNALPAVNEKLAKGQEVVKHLIDEKDLFNLYAKTFDSNKIIVIDDLERISEDINLIEVLGIIEELKKLNYIKIILVVNRKELSETNKEQLSSYEEKVIDRIYTVTNRAKNIDWETLGIDADFISVFLIYHEVKNIRTLIKAQKFYEDVKIKCKDIQDKEFLNEIRLICYAIVVEITDNLYLRETNEDLKGDNVVFRKLTNDLTSRIGNYLRKIKSDQSLVNILLDYYQNSENIDNDDIVALHNMFLKAGEKSDFYKTDEELKLNLLEKLGAIRETKNLKVLNYLVDNCVIWSTVIGIDFDNVLEQYGSKLEDILKKEINNGNEDILFGGDATFLKSSDVIKLHQIKINENKRWLIESYVSTLNATTDNGILFEASYKLRQYYNNAYFKEIFKSMTLDLYNQKFFPIEAMDDFKYHACFNVMYVLYKHDEEKFERFYTELLKLCDRMAKYRMEKVKSSIEDETKK